MSAITPQQFAAHWQNTTLGERQSYQIHFMDICNLIGHEPPTGEDTDAQERPIALSRNLNFVKMVGAANGF